MMIIKISDGPSREELFDSLRLIAEKRYLEFVLKTDPGGNEISKIQLLVLGAEYEEGGILGENWTLVLCVDFSPENPRKPSVGKIMPETVYDSFYSTRKRTGWLEKRN